MRTSQAILVATTLLATAISSAPLSNVEARENVEPRFIIKRTNKRDLTATLVADRLQVVADNKAVAADTIKNAAAVKAVALDVATLTADTVSDKAIKATSDAASNVLAADQKQASFDSDASKKATAAAAVGQKLVDDSKSSVASYSSLVTKAGSDLDKYIPSMKADVPSPDTYGLGALTTSYSNAIASYRAATTDSDRSTYSDSAASSQKSIDTILAAHTSYTAYSSDYSSVKSTFASFIKNLASQSSATTTYNNALANQPLLNVAMRNAAATSLASTTLATADAKASAIAFALVAPADALVLADKATKSADDKTAADFAANLKTDSGIATNDKAQVVTDMAAIALAATTADKLGASTLATTGKASAALAAAQVVLASDTTASNAASAASDKAANNLAAAKTASANAVTASSLALAAQGKIQTAYTSAAAQAAKTLKTYTDALTSANAMTHGGAKNKAVAAAALLKPAADSDGKLSAAASTALTSANSAYSAAKALVLATGNAVSALVTTGQNAADKLTKAQNQVTTDNTAVAKLTTTYNAALALSNSAATAQTAADLAYKCSLVTC